ncbi:MAG TPA: ribonuclease H-like domain-containing protein [Bacteroidota bacterium]|nr:ribonuclease H-like domain-containing protein [Bacteroidota bacterium]
MPLDEVYYDLETQLSAEEVGGWNNIHAMRISIAVTWCERDLFKLWDEESAVAMIEYLGGFGKVISFNGDGFDSRVLSRYGSVAAINQHSFDVLFDLSRKLGHRVSLDSVAQATLGVGKSADGLIALKWWKEKEIDLLAEYCRKDVQVLRDVVFYGRANGHVKYSDRYGGSRSVNVAW